ncbi:hypothetical protein ACHWQZ_G014235 [Mnemiopsis leidyi]
MQALILLLFHLVLSTEETLDYEQVNHGTKAAFTTSCNLTVMSTLASGRSENSWDGDVQFLAGDNSILDIGLHPELQRLAVKNEVFERGSENWGYHWVDGEYPNVNKDLEREYTFNFDVSNQTLVLTCEGESSRILIEIPFTELTKNVDEFLNSIDEIAFHLQGNKDHEQVFNTIRYSKSCSSSGQCSHFNSAWDHVIRDVTQPIQHNESVKIKCKHRYVNLGERYSTCKDGTLVPDPECRKAGKVYAAKRV